MLGFFFEQIIVSGHFDLYMTSVLTGVMKKTQTQNKKQKQKKLRSIWGFAKK